MTSTSKLIKDSDYSNLFTDLDEYLKPKKRSLYMNSTSNIKRLFEEKYGFKFVDLSLHPFNRRNGYVHYDHISGDKYSWCCATSSWSKTYTNSDKLSSIDTFIIVSLSLLLVIILIYSYT